VRQGCGWGDGAFGAVPPGRERQAAGAVLVLAPSELGRRPVVQLGHLEGVAEAPSELGQLGQRRFHRLCFGVGRNDHADAAVERAKHCRVIQPTRLLHPPEDGWERWMERHVRVQVLVERPGQILEEPAVGDVPHCLDEAVLEEREAVLEVNLGRDKQLVADSGVLRIPRAGTVVREAFLLDQLPDEAEAVAVNDVAPRNCWRWRGPSRGASGGDNGIGKAALVRWLGACSHPQNWGGVGSCRRRRWGGGAVGIRLRRMSAMLVRAPRLLSVRGARAHRGEVTSGRGHIVARAHRGEGTSGRWVL
jgi:hypothetical protein